MRELDRGGVKQRLGDVLARPEIEGLMARRDKIVAYFDEQIAKRGEKVVICSLPGH